MPARKSNVSTASNGPEEVSEIAATKPSKEKDGVSVEDLSLPKSMIARLAKGVLPANTQIHKDALLALHKSATVFVSYIASNSNENAQGSGKKTISPKDVTEALKDAELGDFLPRLEAELKKYNDTQCDKRNTYRRKVKEEKAAAAAKGDVSEVTDHGTTNGDANGEVGGHADDEDGIERPVKKVKRENGVAAVPGVDEEGDDADDDDEDDENEAEDAHEEAEDESVDGEEGSAADDGDDDDDEGDDEDVEESGQDETMEDPLDEDERSGIHDEALDDSDSD